MRDRSIFDRVKEEVSILDFADKVTTLRGGDAHKRGRCPVNGCGRKSKTKPFAVWPARGSFHCYGCGAHGDVIELACLVLSCTAIEAARDLLGGQYDPPPKPEEARDREARSSEAKLRIASELWNTAKPIAGTLAERYLRDQRGILQEIIDLVAPALRYNPFAKHSWDDEAKAWIKAPALLVRPSSPAGPTGGTHATYLRRDGGGRDRELGKLMWGPQIGEDGQPGVAWLAGPTGEGLDGSPLLEGEGLESTLSMGCMEYAKGRVARLVATLSLDRMQGLIHADADRCVDLNNPQPRRGRDGELIGPAFTYPNPPEQPWPYVVVGVDGDMSPLKVRSRSGRGKPMEVVLDPIARAALCGRMAVQAWRAAGVPSRAVVPPGLQDFNDEWRGRLAAASEGVKRD